MIQGWFEDEQPTILARVLIPRLMVNAYATFLVDTGSDSTGIHPDPIAFARFSYAKLENPFIITGATGNSRHFTEPATIAIASANGASVYHYDVNIWIATPQDVPAGLPCILGQDILRDLRMTHDPRTTSLLSRYAEPTARLHCQATNRPGANPSHTRQAVAIAALRLVRSS